jgi:hypothetical protein
MPMKGNRFENFDHSKPSRRAVLKLLPGAMALNPFMRIWAQLAEGSDDVNWPVEIEGPEASFTIYQPQPESFEGTKLTGRAAVMGTPKGGAPVFGVLWREARVSTDRDERVVELEEITVTRARFPEVPEDKQKQLSRKVEEELPNWALTIDLDRLLTTLETAEVKEKIAADLKADPPQFVFVTKPTELVIIDGDPALRPVDGSECMRVINTVHYVLLDPGTRRYYLFLENLWMSAPELLEGPWTEAKSPPEAVVRLTPQPDPNADPEDAPEEGLVPEVMVVTEPIELVTTDGQPEYAALPGNELLYVANTDRSLLLELATQSHFLLVSGRWYQSKSFDGPWTFIAADSLPASFAKIPADSDVGDLRAFVAGTDEANDAVMDAQIPQTAAIERTDPGPEVTYDGDPKFQAIEGVQGFSYAVNSAFTVIRDGRASKPVYFCCHDAVWYMGLGPAGSWKVADAIPAEIYEIPPSCPVYNVTYVYIYGSDATVVYVGYLPGYSGSYVYGGTVVYGTGYTYTVWVGTVYYARPVTYGYVVYYDPLWCRWFSPFSLGGVVRRTRRRRRRRRNRRHDHRRDRHRNRYRNNRHRRDRGAPGPGAPGPGAPGSPRKENNVFADRNGNVHRRNDSGGWESHNNRGGWSGASGSADMKRDHSTRERGNSRANSRGPSRGAGGRGRRR